MPLQLYNTLTNAVEAFVPITPGRVTFYSCGPTVYDYAHIGNFRSFLNADLLRRWLESPLCDGGSEVRQVMNITDVGHMTDPDAGGDAADGAGEDRMEVARKRLLEQKKAGALPADAKIDPSDPYAIADFYAAAFVEDARTLGMKIVEDAERDPGLMPRPSRYIKPMLEMIESLIAKGHAYIAADGVAYFDTQSFPEYGRLSGNTLDKIRSGAGGRVSGSTQQIKRHPADFMLWKPDPTHLMRWDPSKELGRPSALKEGYPGWHIECSVMAEQLLGHEIDLHSGGEDNIFPHHECEIAQSCCAHGTKFFARHWFHTRFLMVEGTKMSKSKGNFYTLRDLLEKGFEPAAIRLELVKTHYRSNSNFTEQGLKDSQRIIDRWRRFVSQAGATACPEGQAVRNLAMLPEPARAAAQSFSDSLNDDLNVAGAIAAINTFINSTSNPSAEDAALLRTFDDVLGVLSLRAPSLARASGSEENARIDALVAARTAARAAKDWPEADRIRKELDAQNVVVTDSPQGPKWSRKVGFQRVCAFDRLCGMGMALAYFLSWRAYGTWLHGDPRLSVDKKHAEYGTPMLPRNSAIESHERRLLKHEPAAMNRDARSVVHDAIKDHAAFRGWPILALNVRTNHAHVVVRADGMEPEPVMAQFKARATRLLREAGLATPDQRLWAHHGSTRHLFDADSLMLAIDYVLNRQD